jgi:hypothetical protein
MSGTIPASAIVSVTPSVLPAGGSALQLSGLMLTTNTRVPIGTVPSFPSYLAVANYFGLSSKEAGMAAVYFLGFDNSNVKPGAMLFAQYPTAAVGAYLRGGNISTLTLTQLQALTGVLTVTINGTPQTSSTINLSSATSFSNAAQIITTALAQTGPTQAVTSGTIGATFTGNASGTALTASATVGVIHIGDTVTGTGIPSSTTIVSQTSGTTGGNGVYVTSASTTASSAAVTASSTTVDITAVSSGTIAIGQQITGSGITADTFITGLGTGTGNTGTYTISVAQTVAVSETLTMVMPTVTYDSVSGAFVVISATTGTASTIGFGSGTIAASLALTQATGAVLSQGAAAATPIAFMDALELVNQNWASFTTGFNPDNSGNANKLLFAEWTNQTDDEYVYVGWDTDITPTESNAATTSLGYLVNQAGYSGTFCIYEPTDLNYASFVMGAIASIDFTETNGRTTLKFRAQSGLTPTVLNETQAANLTANGYNYYAGYASRANGWTFLANGSISGPFLWADSYINQIQLNDSFQVALLNMMTILKSFPYNPPGYAQIDAACADPINAALNFGSIVAGGVLSAAQISEINTAAGNNTAAQAVATRGWYLQIQPATAATRTARGSPPVMFWYFDGDSIQAINLSSVEVQ